MAYKERYRASLLKLDYFLSVKLDELGKILNQKRKIHEQIQSFEQDMANMRRKTEQESSFSSFFQFLSPGRYGYIRKLKEELTHLDEEVHLKQLEYYQLKKKRDWIQEKENELRAEHDRSLYRQEEKELESLQLARKAFERRNTDENSTGRRSESTERERR